MAVEEGQTGGKGDDARKDLPGDGPNDDQGEAITGASNGNAPKIVPDAVPPAPAAAKTTPKTVEGGEAVAVGTIPPGGAQATEEKKADGETPAPVAQDVHGQQAKTAPKKGEGGEAPAVETIPPGGAQAPEEKKADGETPAPVAQDVHGQQAKTAPKKGDDDYRRDEAPAGSDSAPSDDDVRDTKKARELLNDKWGLQWPDPVMLKIMQKGSVTKSSGGITFELEDGGSVKWHESLQGKGEFVGKTGFFAKLDEKEAEATVAICKNRGWTKLTVYGTVKQKDMLWLECKKQGVECANHAPMADSPALQAWAKIQAARTDKNLHGASNADEAPIEATTEIKEEGAKGPKQVSAPAGTEQAADDGKPKVVKSSIGGNMTPESVASATPAASEPAAPAFVTRKEGESFNDFIARKIEEVPPGPGKLQETLREGLGMIRDKMPALGGDERVEKAVCDKLAEGKVNANLYNAVAVIINNEKIGAELPPLVREDPQTHRGGPAATNKAAPT